MWGVGKLLVHAKSDCLLGFSVAGDLLRLHNQHGRWLSKPPDQNEELAPAFHQARPDQARPSLTEASHLHWIKAAC